MLMPVEKNANPRIQCGSPDALAPFEARDIRDDPVLRIRVQTGLTREPFLDLGEVVRCGAIRVVVYTEDPNPVVLRAVLPGVESGLSRVPRTPYRGDLLCGAIPARMRLTRLR